MRQILAALLTVMVWAAPATAWQGAGRVVYPVTDGAIPDINANLYGAGAAVALPDGHVIIAVGATPTAVALHALLPDGSPDPAFGRAGIARIGGLPNAGVVSFQVEALLRRPDGRLLVVGAGPARNPGQTGRQVVIAATPSGARDRSFAGGDGVLMLPVQTRCTCTQPGLAPDGSLIVPGATGTDHPPLKDHPQDVNDFRWVLAKVTPDGHLDQQFGNQGLLQVPGTPDQDSGGAMASVLADGRIIALGDGAVLVRLMPDGTADPSFNAGKPLATDVPVATSLDVTPDGTATIAGRGVVTRYRPDGTHDTSFGHDGTASAPQKGIGFGALVRGADDVLYAWDGERESTYGNGEDAIDITPLTGPGALRTHRVALRLYGGTASTYRTFHADNFLPSLAQTSLQLASVVARPDGSLLATGGMMVAQYSGEGIGDSSGQLAAAAITPDYRLDPTFGGPAQQPTLRLTVPDQTVAAAQRNHAIRVRVTASAPGLVLLRVRDTHGRVLAAQVQPVYRAGTVTFGVQVPPRVLRRLGTYAGRAVIAGGRLRDLIGGIATDTSKGRLG
jgi:uncharacterized delta-60 repeat protein